MYRVQRQMLLRADGSPVTFVQTPHQGRPGSLRPILLVFHAIGGGSLNACLARLRERLARASAHLVIGRDGKVVQMVPFNRRAFHAGRGRWGALEDLNGHAIAILLENGGRAQKRADGGYWLLGRGVERRLEPGEAVLARQQHEAEESAWQAFTADQVETAVAVGQALHAAFGFAAVLGGEDIAPGQSDEPGPAFPMMQVRARVLGGR